MAMCGVLLMTIHYHGTPITPRKVLETLAGRSFCVSFAEPRDVEWCHRHGQSVMLDNGAFSFWKSGKATDWTAYYIWCEQWLRYQTTWAVIPDVIDGTDRENDRLIRDWPHGQRGAPVWHMHEPIDRLERLCSEWSRVCIGSSGEYATVGDARWASRMDAAMNAICVDGHPPVWLHMLRGMQCSRWRWPFASVDSTDIARNHARGGESRTREMADRWDVLQCPATWERAPIQQSLFWR